MEPVHLPEEKLEEIAQKTSEQLLNVHAINSESIHGEDLKDFCQHPQINKFLLFQIYQVWSIQMAKVRHPYFDFNHPEVQDAVQALRNLLSRHIAIPVAEFKPMLERAVYNNINLLLDPGAAFSEFFFAEGEELAVNRFERFAPFFSDLDFVVNSLLRYCQKHNLESISKADFMAKMDRTIELFEQKSGKSFHQYRGEAFEQLTGQPLEQVQQEARTLEAELEARRRQQEEEARQRQAEEERRRQEEEARQRAAQEARKESFFDTLKPAGNAFDLDNDDADPQTEEPANEASPVETPPEEKVPEGSPVSTKKEGEEDSEDQQEFLEMAEALEPEASGEEEEQKPVSEPEKLQDQEPQSEPEEEEIAVETRSILEEKSIHSGEVHEVVPEDDKDEQAEAPSVEEETPEKEPESEPREPEKPLTVAEKFSTQQSGSRLENMNGNQKIKLEEIPIHKQYQFIQKVFDGNNVRFRVIVDKVNNASNKAEVEEILEKFVLSNDDLDKSDQVVSEFISMMRNRY